MGRKSNNKKSYYKIKNWKDYNQALINRGKVTVWLGTDLENIWYYNGKKNQGAQPLYSDKAIEIILTIKEVYTLALRQAVGFSKSIFILNNIKLNVPDYSVLCRRQKKLKVNIRLRKNRNDPVHIVIDSTGLKVYGEGEWKVRQHGYSKRRTWRKLHLGIDESTNEIIAAGLTKNNVSDDSYFETLLEEACQNRKIIRASMDGIYDKQKVYKSSDKNGVHPIIPPRKNGRIHQHGNCKKDAILRDEVLRYIRNHGRRKWKEDSLYHRRSLAETAMFRFKTIFGDKLSARLFENQQVEAFICCNILNKMTELGMPVSVRAN